MPLVRKMGHRYLPWNKRHDVLFTKSTLLKLQGVFHHPNTSRLHNIFKRGKHDVLDKDTISTLDSIRNACDTCQRFGPKPLRFRASIPQEGLVPGDELSIDLKWIDGDAILHDVDTSTIGIGTR